METQFGKDVEEFMQAVEKKKMITIYDRMKESLDRLHKAHYSHVPDGELAEAYNAYYDLMEIMPSGAGFWTIAAGRDGKEDGFTIFVECSPSVMFISVDDDFTFEIHVHQGGLYIEVPEGASLPLDVAEDFQNLYGSLIFGLNV